MDQAVKDMYSGKERNHKDFTHVILRKKGGIKKRLATGISIVKGSAGTAREDH